MKMTIEEITFKMTEAATELWDDGEYAEAIMMLFSIFRICDSNNLDIPDEAVDLNVTIDEFINDDVFAQLASKTIYGVKNFFRNKGL
jgi:hypothetical protein